MLNVAEAVWSCWDSATAARLRVKCTRAPIILLLKGPLPNSLMQISQKRVFQIVFIREVHSSSKRDQLEEAPRPLVHAHDWWRVATWNPTNTDASWHFALKGSTSCIKTWPWYQKSGGVLHPRVWHSATKDSPCDSVNTVEIFATD